MSGWLVVVAVVAGVNPARLAPALPRGERATAERAMVAGAGAALAALALGLLALAGDAVASWWEVSAPTFAVGAGLVLALAAVAQAVRRPRPEPALPGRRAALVPVAVPFVLRPEVGLVALAAGAADREAWVAVGLVLVVAGAAAAAISIGGVAGRVLRWLAAVGSVAALASGIALTTGGVLSV